MMIVQGRAAVEGNGAEPFFFFFFFFFCQISAVGNYVCV